MRTNRLIVIKFILALIVSPIVLFIMVLMLVLWFMSILLHWIDNDFTQLSYGVNYANQELCGEYVYLYDFYKHILKDFFKLLKDKFYEVQEKVIIPSSEDQTMGHDEE